MTVSNDGSKVCICGRSKECNRLSVAFRSTRDPRCGYVELPPQRDEIKYHFSTKLIELRKAYLRHLSPATSPYQPGQLGSLKQQDAVVALHHFHPQVVLDFAIVDEDCSRSLAKNPFKVPLTVTEDEMESLKMNLMNEDRVLDKNGDATDEFFFVPNYSFEKACNDLNNIDRSQTLSNRESSTYEIKAPQSERDHSESPQQSGKDTKFPPAPLISIEKKSNKKAEGDDGIHEVQSPTETTEARLHKEISMALFEAEQNIVDPSFDNDAHQEKTRLETARKDPPSKLKAARTSPRRKTSRRNIDDIPAIIDLPQKDNIVQQAEEPISDISTHSNKHEAKKERTERRASLSGPSAIQSDKFGKSMQQRRASATGGCLSPLSSSVGGVKGGGRNKFGLREFGGSKGTLSSPNHHHRLVKRSSIRHFIHGQRSPKGETTTDIEATEKTPKRSPRRAVVSLEMSAVVKHDAVTSPRRRASLSGIESHDMKHYTKIPFCDNSPKPRNSVHCIKNLRQNKEEENHSKVTFPLKSQQRHTGYNKAKLVTDVTKLQHRTVSSPIKRRDATGKTMEFEHGQRVSCPDHNHKPSGHPDELTTKPQEKAFLCGSSVDRNESMIRVPHCETTTNVAVSVPNQQEKVGKHKEATGCGALLFGAVETNERIEEDAVLEKLESAYRLRTAIGRPVHYPKTQ